jgi:predicted component of type VI protein secretion system
MRFKDVNWNCGNGSNPESVAHAQLAVLMDLRDELKELNSHLGYHCAITRELRGLRRDVKKLKEAAR